VPGQESFYKSLTHFFPQDFALALDNFHSSCLRAPRFVLQKNLSANLFKNFPDHALVPNHKSFQKKMALDFFAWQGAELESNLNKLLRVSAKPGGKRQGQIL
jgi:hypothetical protein